MFVNPVKQIMRMILIIVKIVEKNSAGQLFQLIGRTKHQVSHQISPQLFHQKFHPTLYQINLLILNIKKLIPRKHTMYNVGKEKNIIYYPLDQ